MNTTNYQKEVARTMGALEGKPALCNWALGLSGETGEVIEHIKKYVFHDRVLDIEAVEKELGDVMWYLGAMANELGLSLSDIMLRNAAKLRERYPDGFKKDSEVSRGV